MTRFRPRHILSLVVLDRSMLSMPRNTTISGADTLTSPADPIWAEINAARTSIWPVTLYIFEPPFAGWAPMTGVGNSLKLCDQIHHKEKDPHPKE